MLPGSEGEGVFPRKRLANPAPMLFPGYRTRAPAIPRFELVPADRFSFEYLAAMYNQTRRDYIVYMPMTAIRLHDYVRDNDVVLERSAVATMDGMPLGLVMLGVRPDRTWITRLGVLHRARRCGIGRRLVEYLVAQSRELGVSSVFLEVIENNVPAECLFSQAGFHEVRKLVVSRRPPGPPRGGVDCHVLQALDARQAVELLEKRQAAPSWRADTRFLADRDGLAALRVETEGGGRGWLAYRQTVGQLSHLVPHTEAGDPLRVGRALFSALHTLHPALDTRSEYVPADDPHQPVMQQLGYVESFRRIEMRLDLA